MKLDVPLIGQEDGAGCAPASMSMLFRYYGLPWSEQDILRKIGGTRVINKDGARGTIVVDNATFAANLGLEVLCLTYNINLIPPSFAGEKKKFREKVAKQKGDSTGVEYDVLESYTNAIDAGVNLQMRVPSIEEVTGLLDQGIPSVVSALPRAFYQNKNASMRAGHSFAAIGYNEREIICNDPWLKKELKVGKDVFLVAMAAHAIRNSAYLIALTGRKDRN